MLLSFSIGVSWEEFTALVVLSIMVISVEMINTAIESITDVLFKDYDPRAKAIKDIAAGSVLITAMGAAVIGYIILFEPLKDMFYSGINIAKHTEGDVAIVALVIVLILVVITKAFLGRGEPLRGGMPSGHAAVSFSIWVAITFLTESFMPSLLVFIMAIFIAQSRVHVGIHRPVEVFLGALLGSTITFVLFKIFS